MIRQGNWVTEEALSAWKGLLGPWTWQVYVLFFFFFRVTKVDNNPTLFFHQTTVQQPDELELTGSWVICSENGRFLGRGVAGSGEGAAAAHIRPQSYERGSWQKGSALEWGTSHLGRHSVEDLKAASLPCLPGLPH